MFAADRLHPPPLEAAPAPAAPASLPSRLVVVSLAAGLFSAGVLGVAAATWLRPHAEARPVTRQATPPGQGLQIVLESPPPGDLLEVLPEPSDPPASGRAASPEARASVPGPRIADPQAPAEPLSP